jgi:Trypsin
MRTKRIFLSLLVLELACTDNSQRSTQSRREAGSDRKREADTFHDFAVFVDVKDGRVCTGSIVAPNWIILARHCLPRNATKIIVRSGVRAENCASGPHPCLPIEMTPFRHPTVDLALLRTAAMLPWPKSGFPRIHAGGDISSFDALGYGGAHVVATGTPENPLISGAELTRAQFRLDWQDPEYFGAFAGTEGLAVCDGDSGGPALAIAEGPVIAGILTGSDLDPKGGSCTPPGGFQLWVRLKPFAGWIDAILASDRSLEVEDPSAPKNLDVGNGQIRRGGAQSSRR